MTATRPLIRAQPETANPFDPTLSIWVSASAGSGKTTLLTRRVLRFLLESPVPNILCLTYTRAAAAEMQGKIHERLADWAVMEESQLRDNIADLFGFMPDQARIRHAQRLFTHILDNPEQMRVMTVHAFCQYILHSFPLEAGLLPHFSLLEGAKIAAFEDEVMAEFLAAIQRDAQLGADLKIISSGQSSGRLRTLFRQMFYDRAAWQRFWRAMPDAERYRAELLRLSALDDVDEKGVLAEFVRGFPAAHMQALAEILDGINKTAKANAAIIRAFMAREDRGAHFADYAEAFLTKEGTVTSRLVPADLRKQHPDYAEILEREGARVEMLARRLAAARFIERQCAFYRLMKVLDTRAADYKRRHAVLTYDDLIIRTRDLLSNPELSGWILYKLDRAIDHLLIDEAQDTSPDQWRVIMCLLDEFLSGKGARSDVNRTLFVVGDEKQSIYSFQGADRETYLAIRNKLFSRMAEVERPMLPLDRHQSYRTVSPVLQYVDAVFVEEEARRGVSEAAIQHQSVRAGKPGYVELWPPVIDQRQPSPEPWAPPLQREDYQPAEVILAERMAATIRGWLDAPMMLASQQRAVTPDDVMILLQKRSRLLFPIVRALKDAGIPVAGVDRMVLAEQAAVQDVLSLLRFLLLPQDDLALAEVLRGPFIRLDDAALFELAYGRENTLWQRLQTHPVGTGAADWLHALLDATDYVTPFMLLNRVLFQPCPADQISGQHALTLRLGADAVDPLEELLALSLRHQESATPSLQLFVQSLSETEEESKRELGKITGQVRILTVHGAKGLEAPIIFLPDLARDPHRNAEAASLYWNAAGYPLATGEDDHLLVPMAAAKETARMAREEEHRRLLYVALTRARDVMILCGMAKEGARMAAPWHDLCRKAMERLGADTLPTHDENHVWSYGDRSALVAMPPLAAAPVAAAVLPDWLRRVAEAEKDRQVINPSQIGMHAEKIMPPQKRAQGYQRGSLLHTLLQMLPDIPADQREAMAINWLTRQTGRDEKSARVDALEVMKVLADPVFAPIFSAASQAEVPIIGELNGRIISGQIDRLVIADEYVLVVDYKTNRPPPEKLGDVPEPYLAQMAAYQQLLSLLYPGKKVRCALLWTHIPRLMELDRAALARGATILQKAS